MGDSKGADFYPLKQVQPMKFNSIHHARRGQNLVVCRKFADAGKAVSLALDKPVTLVNDATGARYVVKLVYLGTAPELVKSFTQPATQPATKAGTQPATQPAAK